MNTIALIGIAAFFAATCRPARYRPKPLERSPVIGRAVGDRADWARNADRKYSQRGF